MRAATALSSQPNVEGERKSINSELWHACAGPKVSLPPVGSLVVYFPQGHSEQVAASTQKEVDGQFPNYPNLPSQLICQLHNVTLHADVETDEVFSQMTLQPVNGQEKDAFFPPDIETQNRQPTDFFCKTLTASDTSTHGGFSVPRRAAEKVFPPLDFSKQPPAQELQARDLHDQIWTFRHIYRGQPKRHLLTTGWSVFVSAKRLVAGDSVLFIRDEKGQLLLGIRRANRQQIVMPSSVLSSDSMHIGVLAAAAHAAATSSRFIIFYNPRASPSEFVIPLSKYNKAVYGTRVSVGMRFRMVFETDESTLRRHMGTITGISDLDAVRWPNSQWRNLEVGWDESSAGDRPRRVSVWEIEPASTPFLIYPPPFSLRPKRMRHPVLPGEDDVDGNLKRCLTWLRGDNSNDGLYLQGLGSDPWMRFKQRMETSATLPQPDLYHASGAAAFQEFRGIDASKQRLQTQHSQMLQFRLLQQQSHQSDNPQQQLLPSQRYPHQQPFQKQQHPSAQPQQLPQLPVPQQQLRSQIQAPSLLQQQLQAPSFSQQLHPQQLQQHASLPLQQQAVPMPDLSTQLLNRPQPTLNVPTSTRMQPSISEVDTSNSPILNQFLLQSMFEKCQLPVQDNYQICTSFRPNSSQPERGSFLTTPAAPREMQVTSASFPSNRNTVQTEICSTVANMQQLERPDGPSSITNSFLLSSEPPVQTGLASLPLQSCSNVFQASSQHQEAEPDPWAHQLFEMNGECFSSRGFDIGKDAHAQAIHGTTPVGSFPSSSESLCSLPGSFALPSLADNSMNELMVSSALDEAIMSCGYGWPQIPAPVRTFTKVQKFGSVGRSLDVSRFQNYDELRRELARMFNLEGQLEDPRRSNWQLVFVDNDGDVLLVGDDPWEEFVGCVRIIRILSPSEVQQMSHDGFDSISIPMQQQTSSSSEVCHPWKDSRDPSGGSLDRRVS